MSALCIPVFAVGGLLLAKGAWEAVRALPGTPPWFAAFVVLVVALIVLRLGVDVANAYQPYSGVIVRQGIESPIFLGFHGWSQHFVIVRDASGKLHKRYVSLQESEQLRVDDTVSKRAGLGIGPQTNRGTRTPLR